MAVITISRQFGAGGRTLGKMIAEKLSYTFADYSIIKMIAEKANVSAGWVESVEKEAGTRLSRIISQMVSHRWVDRILDNEKGYIDEEIYLDYLVILISQIAEEGNAVILGRGSQYILDDHPDAYHILLIDDFEHRVQFMVDHYDLKKGDAARVVKNEDKRRLNLYKKLGKQDYDNPDLYHLTMNMRRLGLDAAMGLVRNLVNA